MLINKKEVDQSLNNKDYKKFKQLFQDVSVKSVLIAINEKHRFEYLIKKQDLNFIENLFDFFDKSNEAEKYKYTGMVEFVDAKSTSNDFKLQSKFKFIVGRGKKVKDFIETTQHQKEDSIYQFKYKVLSEVLLKKKNSDINFAEKSFSLVKKHDLLNNYIIRRFGDLALNSDFKKINDFLIKTNVFSNKELKKEYLSYVFQKTTSIHSLDYLMKNFENDIREIFFEKIDKNDFWFDFKVKSQTDEKFVYGVLTDSLKPNIANVTKLIWLEKHHMGFSNSEIPYYINFFKHFNMEKIENLLGTLDRNKYLEIFNRTIEQFENLPEKFRIGDYWSKKSQKAEDLTTSLLKELNYRVPLNDLDFYEKLKKITLKLKLEQSLKVNKYPKKSKKI